MNYLVFKHNAKLTGPECDGFLWQDFYATKKQRILGPSGVICVRPAWA